MVGERRRRRQGGQEIIEFGLVALLLVPLMIGSFITGMNFIRSIQANHLVGNLTNMYIHGADFTTYNMQELAHRLSQGLNLEVGSSFSGQNRANTGNGGRGLLTVTQIMYVGTTTNPNCAAVGAANCTNHDSFVFTQRIQFGNGTLNTESPSSLGDPTAPISTGGIVQNPVTDPGARLPEPGQTRMKNLWQVSGDGRAPLVDGQVSYVVEGYFQSPDLTMGVYQGKGVYARYFF